MTTARDEVTRLVSFTPPIFLPSVQFWHDIRESRLNAWKSDCPLYEAKGWMECHGRILRVLGIKEKVPKGRIYIKVISKNFQTIEELNNVTPEFVRTIFLDFYKNSLAKKYDSELILGVTVLMTFLNLKNCEGAYRGWLVKLSANLFRAVEVSSCSGGEEELG
eukprot:Trichotokara_eunicae@DN11009_c0_g1_i1.p1